MPLTFKAVAGLVVATIRWRNPNGIRRRPLNMKRVGNLVRSVLRWQKFTRHAIASRLPEKQLISTKPSRPSSILNNSANGFRDFPVSQQRDIRSPTLGCIACFCPNHASVGIVKSGLGKPLFCDKCEIKILRPAVQPARFQHTSRTFHHEAAAEIDNDEGTSIDLSSTT